MPNLSLPKKRGRPSKADLAARAALQKQIKQLTDKEILADLLDRFELLGDLTHSAYKGNNRATVVTGSPGVGKSYTIEEILRKYAPKKRYTIVKGTLSAVNLYMLGYKYRNRGDVIVLDDADGIFADEDALNVLKALVDTSVRRTISWMKESPALAENDVPKEYDFEGSFMFVSNTDFQKYVDMGNNKYSTHFEALMNRAFYLDLRIHDRRAISLWIGHIATTGKLFAREGVTAKAGKEILEFINQNRDAMRSLSIRSVMQACQLTKDYPNDWQRRARILLLR